MVDRETIVRLSVGAVIAMLLHAMLLPAMQWSVGRQASWTRELPAELETMLPDPDVRLGRPNPIRASVAWIAHEDFRRLIAPQAQTQQPALQSQAEPIETAPLPTDPTRPAPTPAPLPQQPPAPPSVDALEPEPPHPSIPEPPIETTLADTPAVVPVAPTPPTPSTAPPPRPQPHPPTTAKPTAAPRDRQDVDPTQLVLTYDRLVPGGVIVGDGIEITTARPHFALSALLTAVPNNTSVRVVFNAQGEVIEAGLLGTTGYADFDGPILQSLYRWQARGPKLTEHDRPTAVRVRYLLRPESEENAGRR